MGQSQLCYGSSRGPSSKKRRAARSGGCFQPAQHQRFAGKHVKAGIDQGPNRHVSPEPVGLDMQNTIAAAFLKTLAIDRQTNQGGELSRVVAAVRQVATEGHDALLAKARLGPLPTNAK